MPAGKTQDVLCLFCSFMFFFLQNRRFLPKLVKIVSSKMNKKDHVFCISLSFLFIFVLFAGFG